jgi:TolB-like protein/Tfp pilus assembly protein PilF
MPPFRFAEFELNDQTFELRKNDAPVRIQQQPARVLAFLLNHRGTLVTREQIRLAIWGDDTFVDFEQGLNFCIRQIRLALADQAENPKYVETLPRLGYRFVGKIESAAHDGQPGEEKRLRIAVVPVEDLSGQIDSYFAAGLTEDMISALSRIDPARLRVTAVPRLASGDGMADHLDRLRHELNLDYLLRGTVRRSGDTLRISAVLHDLGDRCVLWSKSYDRKASDLLAVQEEVTQQVSESLALELFPSATVGTRRYARSSAAYDAYLKGRFFWHKMSSDAIGQSMAYFHEALSLDSKFAPAYAGIADCYAQMGSLRVGTMKPLEAVAESRKHLQRALDLDETLAEAHCTLGLIKSWYDWDWDGAGREFQAALALDPSQITALLWQSLFLSVNGQHRESIASVQRARELEPLSPTVNLYLGLAYVHGGQYDLGIRRIQESIELDPGYYRSQMFLGKTLSTANQHDEAVAALERAVALRPDSFESIAFLGFALAGKGDRKGALAMVKKAQIVGEKCEPAIVLSCVYARLGMAKEMYQWLERAVEVKSTPIYIPLVSAEFVPYETEPRYHSFLASIGLSHRARH